MPTREVDISWALSMLIEANLPPLHISCPSSYDPIAPSIPLIVAIIPSVATCCFCIHPTIRLHVAKVHWCCCAQAQQPGITL